MFGDFCEKYGIGFTYYSVSIRDREGCSTATRWFRLFYLPLFPLGRYRVKFYYKKWALNYVSVDVLSRINNKWYENLLLNIAVYIKVYIIGTGLYFGAFAVMFYLDSLGIFKGPHVLLVFAYWIVLTIILYKRRDWKVNPRGNQREYILPGVKTRQKSPAEIQQAYEKSLPKADSCPNCAVKVSARPGENKCSNCGIRYVVTAGRRVSDFSRSLVDTVRLIMFVFAIASHCVFFIIGWEIDFEIVIENNELFLLMMPWVAHYLIVLFIALKYGYIHSPGSWKFREREGDIIKVRYSENRMHFLVHLGLYTLLIIGYLVAVYMVLTGRV